MLFYGSTKKDEPMMAVPTGKVKIYNFWRCIKRFDTPPFFSSTEKFLVKSRNVGNV